MEVPIYTGQDLAVGDKVRMPGDDKVYVWTGAELKYFAPLAAVEQMEEGQPQSDHSGDAAKAVQ